MHRDDTQPQDMPPVNDTDSAAAPDTADGVSADSTGTTADDADRRLAEQQDKYLRLAAEYDNYRRRTTKERGEAHARGQADLVKQLMDPLDDLMRFAHVDPAVTDATTIVEGVAMVERKVLKVLDSLGLTLVNPVDAPFDPTMHEAVATEPAASAEDDDMVARVYQVGYQFNGQLLRPARVVVKQWNG
jgi:molecular chaperone GrpE